MLLAALLAAAACPPATEASVRGAFEAWLVAYRSRDLAGTMAIFDPQVRFQFQGAPDLDWAALRRGEGCRWRIVRSLNDPARPAR